MKTKKTIALILSVLMLATVVACQPSSTSSQSDANNPTTSMSSQTDNNEELPTTGTYPIPGAEGVTLTFWRSMPSNVAQYLTNYDEAEAYQEIMKRTGVTLEFIHPTISEEKTQLNLMLASGEYPDIVTMENWYDGGPDAAVADGFTIDLTPYLPQYAPDFYNLMMNDVGLYRELTDTEGSVSAFGLMRAANPPFTYVNIQNEVMADLDIEMLHTIDDYEAAFEKMLNAGMTPYMLPQNGYDLMMSRPFDARSGFHLDAEGNVVYGQIQDGFKEYVQLMSEWYAKGYISADFVSLPGTEVDAMFDTKLLGMRTATVDGTFSRASAQGYEFTPMPFVRLEEGQVLHLDVEGAGQSRVENFWTGVTTACEEPEIAIQLLNYTYSEEGALLANYGIEGQSWEMVDGKPKFTDYMYHHEVYTNRAAAGSILKLHQIPKLSAPATECNPNTTYNEVGLEMRLMHADDPNKDGTMVLPAIKLSPEATSERADIMAQVTTYVDEMVLKFITGATPMSEWDNYVATVESMDIASAVELTTAAYNEFMAKEIPVQ